MGLFRRQLPSNGSLFRERVPHEGETRANPRLLRKADLGPEPSAAQIRRAALLAQQEQARAAMKARQEKKAKKEAKADLRRSKIAAAREQRRRRRAR
jgi:hypothetical protein